MWGSPWGSRWALVRAALAVVDLTGGDIAVVRGRPTLVVVEARSTSSTPRGRPTVAAVEARTIIVVVPARPTIVVVEVE